MGGAKNCPETPRQKMIGMMYLVLTAMLALNVSTDILNGFTLVDNSLHSSIDASDKRNAQLYNDFKAANADNPEKTQEWFDKAVEVQKRADSLFNYIQDFKEHIAILADSKKKVDELKAQGIDPTRHIEGNSNLDVTGQYAIVQGNGLILKEMVAYYRDYAAELADQDAELRNSIMQNWLQSVAGMRMRKTPVIGRWLCSTECLWVLRSLSLPRCRTMFVRRRVS